jgi:hypothetical protein
VLDLHMSGPGRYWLRVNLREGDHGQFRYTALQGGENGAQIASWSMGLASGIWLALGALVVFELLGERGWIRLEEAG